jgi:hypothetical protein
VERREQWVAFAPGSGEVHVSEGDDELAQDAGQHDLLLMVDYSAEMPLWGRVAKQVELDPALVNRLAAWQREFDNDFQYEKGWRSADARDRWAAEAVELEAQLRAALPGVKLKVDLWPLVER